MRNFCRLGNFIYLCTRNRENGTRCRPKANNGAIAQLVEQRTENPCIPGSIPGGTTASQPTNESLPAECFFCVGEVVGIGLIGQNST